MKKLLLLSTVLILASCFPMKTIIVDIPPSSDQVEAIGSKNELFVKANNWMVENFVSAKSVIQFADKESGVVIGKYLMHQSSTAGLGGVIHTSEVYSIIKIQVKDGASKITIDPSEFTELDTSNKTMRERAYSKAKAEMTINDLIQSFKSYMIKEVKAF